MNKSITQATQNDKQISESIKSFFHRVSYFLSLEGGQCLQKERYSCNGDFSIHVSADFLQQKYVYESAHRKKYP